jgi:hypothetical protein
MFRHLISTRPLFCRCSVCHSFIWYALDGGLPVYCDVDELSLPQELVLRLNGVPTYNFDDSGMWYRDEYGVGVNGIVLGAHPHRGFYALEKRPCPTGTSRRATDSSPPPF